jgi:hypothetical protein
MECNVPSPLERDPNLPAGLAATTMKALAKSPQDRFASARDFAVALEKAADAAGMLATSHEVEEAMARLFSEEIELKNAAVRGHLSRSGGAPLALKKGELSVVSKLIQKKLAHKPRVEMKTRTGVPGAPTAGSGVRERSREMELAATATNTPAVVVAAPGSVPEWTGAVKTEVLAPSRASAWGVALGVVGIVSILGALAFVLFGGSAPPASPPTVTEPPPAVTTPPADPAPAPVVDVVPAPVPAPEPVVAPVATPEAAPIVAPEHTPVEGRPHVRPRPAAVVAPEATPTPEPTPEPTPPPAHTSPTLEANPYH